ncbi:MAG: EVE domain-containing protein [Phycisphaeraceae bacterium]|nr:EVE domain-containing protein [Phycisphaeraceae bacterium]
MFQGNPDVFDIDGYLATTREILWLVRQHVTRVAVGDIVYLYRCKGHTGKDGGLVARGIVVDSARVTPDDDGSTRFWLDESHALKPEMRARIRLESVADGTGALSRTALLNTPMGRQLPNLPNGQGTNFLLPDDVAGWLDILWSQHVPRS